MKVAIYLRVSRTDQILDNQKLPLVKYCESKGYEYEIFEEKESTRKTRPVQWELYNKLLRKEFDGLVIYKFDRWARSSKELINHIEALMEAGIFVFSYSEALDLNTSMGRAMFTVMSAFAQLERDIIRERTLAGLARAKAQGKKLGRPFRIKRKPKNCRTCNKKRVLNRNKDCVQCSLKIKADEAVITGGFNR